EQFVRFGRIHSGQIVAEKVEDGLFQHLKNIRFSGYCQGGLPPPLLSALSTSLHSRQLLLIFILPVSMKNPF
ncbi:MAG: hypothetical protein Q7T24_00985, partial [Deltaproteobacteria bacterium]|nr:hypothetical protein [Deltaproteobacteria bacterium]